MVDGDYEAFTRRIDIDEAQLDAALLAIERYDGNASPSPREAGRALLLGRLGRPAPPEHLYCAEAVAMVDAAEAEAQAEARQRAARANIEARIGGAAAKALAPEGAPVTIVLPRSVMAPPVDDEVD